MYYSLDLITCYSIERAQFLRLKVRCDESLLIFAFNFNLRHCSKVADGVLSAGTSSWAEYYASRQRLAEAVNINTGLLALKKCIDALHEVGGAG